MNRNLIIYLYVFFAAGCELFNPEEMTPSYLKLEDFTLSTNSSTEGSNSHNITDVWVYIDGNLQGIYEIPAQFPILEDGTHEFSFGAGVKMNGMSSTRIEYPFYKRHTDNITLFKDSIIQTNLSTQYYSNVTFQWIEDFDQPGPDMTTTSISNASLQRVTSSSLTFGGNGGSGAAYLDTLNPIFECISNNQFNLPMWGTPVFLELNYKTTSTLFVGLQVQDQFLLTTQKTILGINPSNEWKKIYINLTNAILEEPNATSFGIFLGTGLSDTTYAEIYFDNLKLLY